MPQFVLEIGTEEMPAGFLPRFEKELGESLAKAMDDARIGHDAFGVCATPRRIIAHSPRVELIQEEREEVFTGPPMRAAYDAEGAPTKAAQGFARSQGVELDATFALTKDNGEYLAVRKTTGGAKTADLLQEICPRVVASMSAPKRMRWGDHDALFGRPIRWLLALLGDEAIPFAIAGVQSRRETHGHRVAGPGPWTVDSAEMFFGILREKGRVTPETKQRLEVIRRRGDELASKVDGAVVWKESLLREVAGLVEMPTPILADFDPSFLELPRQVLLTSMESHQKSFGVEDANGNLLPRFVPTLNIEPKDPELVKKGWERVLKARLEDARFFWKTDLAKSLDDWRDELENVVFLGPLGVMADKSRRLSALGAYLAANTRPELAKDMQRAGELAKTDLVSEMVGEFADLQGVMGGIYARLKGENETVSKAISEQYLPAGPESPTPSTLAGGLLSMADRADTLAGCFGLSMIPTGANDPYGLRRGALGICRVILDNGLRVSLKALLEESFRQYGEQSWKQSPQEAIQALLEFFAQRLKFYFMDEGQGGYATLVVEAAIGAGVDDVWSLAARVKALSDFSREPDFEQAVLTFKRAANIIRKQAGELGASLNGVFNPALFEQEEEKALAAALESMTPRFDALWAEDKYGELLGLLRELRPTVDAFFDHVMVMTENTEARQNRLNMLSALVNRLGALADFNLLQV